MTRVTLGRHGDVRAIGVRRAALEDIAIAVYDDDSADENRPLVTGIMSREETLRLIKALLDTVTGALPTE